MSFLQRLSCEWHALFARQSRRDFASKVAQKETPDWMVRRIRQDLAPFSQTGIGKKKLDEIMRILEPRDCPVCVRYRIENNQLSIPYPHRASGRRFQWITAALLFLCKNAPIPDMECIICLEDAIDRAALTGPVLTFAKHIDTHHAILMPDMDALSYRVHKSLYDIRQGVRRYPWGGKKDMAFWRGATTGYALCTEETFLALPRTRAITASLASPHLIDARFTQLVQSPDRQLIEERYAAYFSPPCSIKRHLKYKYQLLIDGNTCAYSRAYWQLFSNCALFKQASDNRQWFYDLLEPHVHYIPLQHDMSDLKEKIAWAKENDAEMSAMALRMQRLANACLKPADVYLYLYLLLLELAKLPH